MIGKSVRLERIIDRNSGRTVIIPMDHGVTVGPIKGLTNLRDAVSKVVAGGANAVLMHKGSPRFCHRGSGKDVGLIIHLSAGTTLSPDPNAKELACTVEEAIENRGRRAYRCISISGRIPTRKCLGSSDTSGNGAWNGRCRYWR